MSTPYDEQDVHTSAPDVARIRELNDTLRMCRDPITALAMNSSIIFTRTVVMLGEAFVNHAFNAVAAFDEFTPDNDPHGEHDMAFLDVDGEHIFFKVDYYDREMRNHSDDPSNPESTRRVLTIGLASDY
jgi:hypothetical protein